MQTTVTRYVPKSSQLGGSHTDGTPDIEGFFKRFTLRGRDPAMADENLYRYCDNSPTDATDPSGEVETKLVNQDPKSGNATGIISITTTEPFKPGPNGDFRWGIKWSLKADDQIEGGDGSQAFVLQEVTYRVVVRNLASGKDITKEQAPSWFKERAQFDDGSYEVKLWEAWQFVPKGTYPTGTGLPVFKNQPGMPPSISDAKATDDVYRNEGTWGGKGTIGQISIQGDYGLVQGIVPQASFKIGEFGGADPSGGAWSTWTDPQLKVKNVGSHILVVRWCDQNPEVPLFTD